MFALLKLYFFMHVFSLYSFCFRPTYNTIVYIFFAHLLAENFCETFVKRDNCLVKHLVWGRNFMQ